MWCSVTCLVQFCKCDVQSFRVQYFQVETFTPCLQRRRLLAGDPPSRCSASSIQAGNPHPTPILLLLPHPTWPDRRRERDTFHPNHRPLHQISAGLSHGARSIARTSRSIWQRRSKSRPHAQMRSGWLPFVPTPRSWRSTSPSRPPLTPHAPTPRCGWLL